MGIIFIYKLTKKKRKKKGNWTFEVAFVHSANKDCKQFTAQTIARIAIRAFWNNFLSAG